jgi:hypothetical protein
MTAALIVICLIVATALVFRASYESGEWAANYDRYFKGNDR